MNITLVVYAKSGTYQGESVYQAMRGITIEDFFKMNKLEETYYEVRVHGIRPTNLYRFYNDTVVRLTDVTA